MDRELPLSSGGTAALYGFLYQILAKLSRVSQIHMEGRVDDIELSSVRMILEPAEGGGDARYEAKDTRIVEQYKTRQRPHPWTLGEIIKQVLPDLLKAVNDSEHPQARYRFVTEGSVGDLSDFLQFCKRIPREAQDAGHLLRSLDDRVQYAFFRRRRKMTDRQMFENIAGDLLGCDREVVRENRHCLRVARLLADFDVRDRLTAKQFEKLIDSFLIERIEYPDWESAREKREELCGHLLDRLANAKTGGFTTTPQDLLAEVGITGRSLDHNPEVLRRVMELVVSRAKRLGHDPSADVRQPPSWEIGKPVLLIAGASGQGKSWQLARLALDLLERGQLAILGQFEDSASRSTDVLVNTVWQEGFGRTRPISTAAFATGLKNVRPGERDPSLTLCIDDVHDQRECLRLVDGDWASWNLRLAIALPDRLAGTICKQRRDSTSLILLQDFTPTETREALSLRGRDWDSLPPDFRELLRKPILAGLFCQLRLESGWFPRNEYEVFEAHWSGLDEEYEHPHDRDRFVSLLETCLSDQPAYRWHPDILNDHDITEDMILRLERTGWIRQETDGAFAIPHHRLLNWAIAECLVTMQNRGRANTQFIVQYLCRCLERPTEGNAPHLGYVPMDYLWLATAPGSSLMSDISEILEAIEKTPTFTPYPGSLYKDLLPTLGDRIIPALVDRLQRHRATRPTTDHLSHLIAEALISIGMHSADPIHAAAANMLKADDLVVVNVALVTLRALPSTLLLDTAWEIHINRTRGLENEQDRDRTYNYRVSYSAVESCARLNHPWLISQIAMAKDGATASQLAYLVAALRDPQARSTWRETKATLLATVPTNRPLPLIRCIHRFLDHEEVDRLTEWVETGEPAIKDFAFAALCDLDPDRALRCMSQIGSQALYITRHSWNRQLGRERPGELREVLLCLAESAESGPITLCKILDGSDEITNETIVRRVCEGIVDRLRQDPMSTNWLYYSLRFLRRVVDPNALQYLRNLGGSEFDRLLSEAAATRVASNSAWSDPILDEAQRVLLRIGGVGFSNLIHKQLSSSGYWDRFRAYEWAMVRPDSEIRDILRTLAKRPVHSDEDRHERHLLQRILAIHREDAALVSSVIDLDSDVVIDAPFLRGRTPPMKREILDVAIRRLEGAHPDEIAPALSAIACSGDPSLVPFVHALLDSAPVAKLPVLLVLRTLFILGDRSERFVDLAASRLRIKSERAAVARMLFAANTPEALSAISTDLACGSHDRIHHDDWIDWISLWHRPEFRQFVADRMTQLSVPSVPRQYRGWILEILAETDSPEVHDQLLEVAFDPAALFPDQTLCAIRGLRLYDVDAAFRAGLFAICRYQQIADATALLLLSMDEKVAIQELVELAEREHRTTLTWTTGRCFRRVSDQETLSSLLAEMLLDSDQRRRETAAELAGWMSHDSLSQPLEVLAAQDMDEGVRRAAKAAIEQRSLYQRTADLYPRFSSLDNPHRWDVLLTILDNIDPRILQDDKDPLGLRALLIEAEPVFRDFAEKRLAEKVRKLPEEAARRDKTRKAGGA